jgi:PAS domain S-box-containing protein
MADVNGNEELQNRILLLEKEIKSLKNANEKYQSMLETSPASIMITDRSGKIVYTNSNFHEVTGYTFDEVYGKTPAILNSGAQSHAFYEKLWSAILHGDIWQGELYNRKKNGEFFWERAMISPVKDDDGEITNFVAIKFEITKQKQAEDQLRDQIQSKDKLLSIISHDLKSPFGSVVGLTDLVIENYGQYPPDEILTIFQLVNSSARFALDLLENLLNWGRSQTGMVVALPSLFTLSHLVTETIGTVEGQAVNKGVIIHSAVDESMKVNADSNWTKIVLRNLLTNAIKFSRRDGEILISAIKNDGFIAISVDDRGIGIAAEDIPKLFDMNSKFTMLGTSNEKGTGLGLLLCKEFIEKQGGKIWVKSQLGEGSRFTFTLPDK